MQPASRPQTSIFHAADLIFRYETFLTPKRPSTPLSLSPSHRKSQTKSRDKVYSHPQSRLGDTAADTQPAFHFDNQIRMLGEGDGRKRRAGESPKVGLSPGNRASTPSPSRLHHLRSLREDLFHRVVAACAQVPQSKPLEQIIDRERAYESLAMKHWTKAQARLRKMKAYDPDLLVPLYVLEREAEAFNEREVREAVKRRKGRGSVLREISKTASKAKGCR